MCCGAPCGDVRNPKATVAFATASHHVRVTHRVTIASVAYPRAHLDSTKHGLALAEASSSQRICRGSTNPSSADLELAVSVPEPRFVTIEERREALHVLAVPVGDLLVRRLGDQWQLQRLPEHRVHRHVAPRQQWAPPTIPPEDLRAVSRATIGRRDEIEGARTRPLWQCKKSTADPPSNEDERTTPPAPSATTRTGTTKP